MASKVEEQIIELEAELKKTPYNKATHHHIGLIKAKLSRLREKKEGGGGKGGGEGFSVRKSGDATVVLVGFPSVGKSTLLNKLTNAASKTAAYAFTTLSVIPGIMEYEGAMIQLLDVPGIIEGATRGTGRGKEVLSVVRNSNLILIMLDNEMGGAIKQHEIITEELYNAGFRLNARPPNVVIKKRERGGLKVDFTFKQHEISEETVKSVMKEFKVINGDVIVRENVTVDQLIDAAAGNRIYIPAVTVINKIDAMDSQTISKLRAKFNDAITISAENETNLEELRKVIFSRLGLMRVYLKRLGKKADLQEPLIIKRDSTVRDVCEKIHREFLNRFRFARVWGKSARFPGQKFKLDHVLKDKDVVQIHLS